MCYYWYRDRSRTRFLKEEKESFYFLKKTNLNRQRRSTSLVSYCESIGVMSVFKVRVLSGTKTMVGLTLTRVLCQGWPLRVEQSWSQRRGRGAKTIAYVTR